MILLNDFGDVEFPRLSYDTSSVNRHSDSYLDKLEIVPECGRLRCALGRIRARLTGNCCDTTAARLCAVHVGRATSAQMRSRRD